MRTAWPTLGLFLGVWTIVGFSVYGYFVTPAMWAPLWVLLLTLSVYLNFTVLHDSSHGAVSRSHPVINKIVGNICALYMHGSYKQFVMVHHRHHAYTNQPGKDPDMHCSGPISVGNVLRWGCTLYYYFRYYLREKPRGGKWLELGVIGPYILVWGLYILAFFSGHLRETLLLWTLPNYLGAVLSIFILDYIPHAPHSSEGRYTHSRTIIGRGYQFVSMMHAYHIAHHLWPQVPWYQYRKIYEARRSEILAGGNQEIHL